MHTEPSKPSTFMSLGLGWCSLCDGRSIHWQPSRWGRCSCLIVWKLFVMFCNSENYTIHLTDFSVWKLASLIHRCIKDCVHLFWAKISITVCKMNVLESCSLKWRPSVWIRMASCLTTHTDHVRLHLLTEFIHCWYL